MSRATAAASRKRTRERKARQSKEAIQARAVENFSQSKRDLENQAASLVAEAQQLAEREEAAAGEQHPGRQAVRALKRARSRIEDRRLRLLERDEAYVRAAIRRREKLSGIMAADAVTDGDELLWFIAEELKLLSVFEQLAPARTYLNEAGEETRRRTMYSPLVLNLLGVLSRSVGAASNPEIQATLLTDERWMSVLGFNVAEVEKGSTRRSEGLMGKSREDGGGRFTDAGPLGPARARLEGPRGALSSQTLSNHENSLEPQDVADAFNKVIETLASHGYFGPRVRVAIDSTGEEVVPSFAGAGVVSKDVKVESKARRPKKMKVRVLGFKLWYVMDVETGLPLAMVQDTIETPETAPARALIEQAMENLQGCSKVVSCALDRGFLAGDLLWWLTSDKGIIWTTPSKENMLVTAEARARVDHAVAALCVGDELPLQTAERAARRGLSHDGVLFFEREVKANSETLVVAQVDGLTDTDFYGPGGSSSSRSSSKSFEPTPLFATIVLRWPNRSAEDNKDAQVNDTVAKGPVVLLSPIQEPALVRYDRYDERSLIENRLNRDAKQYFGLGQSLARTSEALWSATLFSTLALVLYRALQIHREQAEEQSDQRCEELGVLRYRRQLAMKNRNRVIVVVADRYGIFTFREYSKLLGMEFL